MNLILDRHLVACPMIANSFYRGDVALITATLDRDRQGYFAPSDMIVGRGQAVVKIP